MIQELAQYQWTALNIIDLVWFHGLGPSGESDIHLHMEAWHAFAKGATWRPEKEDSVPTLLNGWKLCRCKALLASTSWDTPLACWAVLTLQIWASCTGGVKKPTKTNQSRRTMPVWRQSVPNISQTLWLCYRVCNSKNVFKHILD